MNTSWSIWGQSTKNNAQEIACCFDEKPIVLCLGTNKLLDDSLGPMVGSMLKKMHYDGFVYGTLDAPISAINIKDAIAFLKAVHKDKKILIVDASTTSHLERIGKIVLTKEYKPFNQTLFDLNLTADYFLFGVCCLHKKHFKTLFNSNISIITNLCKTICYGILNIAKNSSSKNQKALKFNSQKF